MPDQASDTSMLAFSKMLIGFVLNGFFAHRKVQLDSERQTPTEQSAQPIRQEQENVGDKKIQHTSASLIGFLHNFLEEAKWGSSLML